MATNGAIFAEQLMTRGRCPHCSVVVRFEPAETTNCAGGTTSSQTFRVAETFDRSWDVASRWFVLLRCPNCFDIIVWMSRAVSEADRTYDRIYPPRSDHGPAPAGTPDYIARAYEEAARVLPVSANAAAALARRTLQLIMREILGVEPSTLKREIDSASKKLPDYLIDGLHALREVGNFALHPKKDNETGSVIETEPQEAELTVALVEALLQQQFAGREESQRLSDLLAARKPQLAQADRSNNRPDG